MSLNVAERHQLAVAKKTLLMPDAIVGVMGYPNKQQAREIIRQLETKKRSGRKPRRGLSGLRRSKRKSRRKSRRK